MRKRALSNEIKPFKTKVPSHYTTEFILSRSDLATFYLKNIFGVKIFFSCFHCI